MAKKPINNEDENPIVSKLNTEAKEKKLIDSISDKTTDDELDKLQKEVDQLEELAAKRAKRDELIDEMYKSQKARMEKQEKLKYIQELADKENGVQIVRGIRFTKEEVEHLSQYDTKNTSAYYRTSLKLDSPSEQVSCSGISFNMKATVQEYECPACSKTDEKLAKRYPVRAGQRFPRCSVCSELLEPARGENSGVKEVNELHVLTGVNIFCCAIEAYTEDSLEHLHIEKINKASKQVTQCSLSQKVHIFAWNKSKYVNLMVLLLMSRLLILKKLTVISRTQEKKKYSLLSTKRLKTMNLQKSRSKICLR